MSNQTGKVFSRKSSKRSIESYQQLYIFLLSMVSPIPSCVLDSIRNYAILHIVSDEAKIFTTKERAPVLLHFEAFRPEELMLYIGQPEKPLSLGVKKRTTR